MADNTQLSAAVGSGDTIRTVNRTNVKTSVGIIDLGGESGPESLLIAGQTTMAGSISVAIASNQSAVPVSGTFWQTTQPVSAASLPLPSGAATAAKQPALGTAGSASADVLSVQGIASMTPLFVGGNVASGASDSGNPVKAGGVYNSSAPTFTTGQRGDLQIDSSGYLKVNVSAGSAGNGAASNTGSAVPAQADYGGVNVAGTLRGQTAVNPSGSIYAAQVDIASLAGTTADTNSGSKSAGTLRVVLATDQPQLTNALKVDASATTQPISGTVAATQSGTWNVATVTSVTSVTAVGSITSALPAGTNVIGHVIVDTAPTTAVTIATAPVLVAGSAIIGKVGVDQTTPGTTNAVSLAQLGSTTVSTGNGVVGAGVLRVSLASDSTGQVALAAGSALVGSAAVGQQTNQVFKGATANTPQYLAISVSTSGNTTLIAAGGAGKVIKILKLSLFAGGGANTVKLQDFDGASTYTDLMPSTPLLANQPMQLSYCPVGNLATQSNHAFTLNLSAATAVTGYAVYVVE
jgi:hypothetical protein